MATFDEQQREDAPPDRDGKAARRQSIVRLGLTALISVAAVVAIYSHIDWAEAASLFVRLPVGLFVVGACVSAILPLVATLRWWMMLRVVGHRANLARLLMTLLGIYPISLLTPGRLGDLLRAYGLRGHVAMETSVAGLILERMMDLAVLGSLSMCWFIVSGASDGSYTAWALLILFAGLSPILLWFAFWGAAGMIHRIIPIEAVASRVRRFADATQRYARGRGLLLAPIAMSILYWSIVCGFITYCYRTLGADVGYADVAGGLALAILVGLLPITVAGIGTRDAALIFFLSGLASEEASAVVAMLYTLFFYVAFIIVGLPFVRRSLRARSRL